MKETEKLITTFRREDPDDWETIFVCRDCKIKYNDTFERWTIPKKLREKLWREKGIRHSIT